MSAGVHDASAGLGSTCNRIRARGTKQNGRNATRSNRGELLYDFSVALGDGSPPSASSRRRLRQAMRGFFFAIIISASTFSSSSVVFY